MALTTTTFLRSTPNAFNTAVETGGYLVGGSNVAGQWGAYNLATNTSRVFLGLRSSVAQTPNFVAYGGYAWTIQGIYLMRLNPVTGGVAQEAMTHGLNERHQSVLIGSTLYVVYRNTHRMISIDLSAATPTSTLVTATTGHSWDRQPVYGSDGAIWASTVTGPVGIYRFTLAGVATKVGTAPTSGTNLIESGGYIYYGKNANFYRINIATSDWESFTFPITGVTGEMAVGPDGRIYCSGSSSDNFFGLDPATGLTQEVGFGLGFNNQYMVQRSSGQLWFLTSLPDPWP